MSVNILRTKSVEQSIRDTEEPEHQLKKALGPIDLIVFGIGVIVGTGIFVLTGVAAATRAGPAITLSFVVAGIACGLAALCYAEFASSVPVAGRRTRRVDEHRHVARLRAGLYRSAYSQTHQSQHEARTPFVPIVPILAALICLYIMVSLPLITWIRFLIWLVIGVVLYFSYSMHHSRLWRDEKQAIIQSERDLAS